MRIPSYIKLGGHRISIEFADTAHIGGKGEYNSYHNLIRLERESDTPESNVSECLLHEIIEAIRIKNNLTIEHTDLTVLSESLFQVLKDNAINFNDVED